VTEYLAVTLLVGLGCLHHGSSLAQLPPLLSAQCRLSAQGRLSAQYRR
jgi:hypothetical protein